MEQDNISFQNNHKMIFHNRSGKRYEVEEIEFFDTFIETIHNQLDKEDWKGVIQNDRSNTCRILGEMFNDDIVEYQFIHATTIRTFGDA